MGQPVAVADCSSFARPSWAHAPGETRTIKATIAKRVVAAPQSARLRDGTICAFYNRRNRTGRSGPRQGRAERRLWRIGCRGRTIYGEGCVYTTLWKGILVGPVFVGYTQEVFQAWPRLRISGKRYPPWRAGRDHFSR